MDQEIADKALQALKTRHGSQRVLKITRSIPNFRGGDLVVVETFDEKESIRLGESYAWIFDKKVSQTFMSLDELLG